MKAELFPFQKRALADLRMKVGELIFIRIILAREYTIKAREPMRLLRLAMENT